MAIFVLCMLILFRTFDKVVDGDLNVLVVFQEQSWKEIKDFEKICEDLRDRRDFLIVRVDGTCAYRGKKYII